MNKYDEFKQIMDIVSGPVRVSRLMQFVERNEYVIGRALLRFERFESGAIDDGPQQNQAAPGKTYKGGPVSPADPVTDAGVKAMEHVSKSIVHILAAIKIAKGDKP